MRANRIHSRPRQWLIQTGNSHILHSRAKVLGGCSSHNTLISYRPFRRDMEEWESLGADGWSFDTVTRCIDQLRNQIQPVHPKHRNALVKDWVSACSTALDIPVIDDFNKTIRRDGGFKHGVGFFSVAYHPEDGKRSSASVAYLHPIIRGDEKRDNLVVLTDAWVSRVNVSASGSLDKKAESVDITLKSGFKLTLAAKTEIVLCAGAVDTPRLLLLSGIGPAKQLQDLAIPVVHDLPGVGENLLDHPESIILWELHGPMPSETTMDSDAGIFLDRAGTGNADIMMHTYQVPTDKSCYSIIVPFTKYDLDPILCQHLTSRLPSPATRLLYDAQHPQAALPGPAISHLLGPKRQARPRLPLLHGRRRLRRPNPRRWLPRRPSRRRTTPVQEMA